MVARQIESKTIFSAVDRVSPVTAKIAKGMNPLTNQLSKVGKSFKDFGGSTLLKSGAGLTGMFYGLAKPAMAFEKSMAQVFKTFDPARIGISNKEFSKTVRNMSSEMGIMATQMADIFENMPLPEILNLDSMNSADKYKGIIKMAEMTAMSLTTMGLEAGDAGNKMKSMFNVLGGKDINKVIQTMNAVNEMGNQFGIKPADTLEFLTRQGGLGLGKTAKLTNLETTAIGGTMLGFGATPETAKTSFQKMINVGQAYTSATKKQKEAFQKLGTSAENFAQSWQKSPTDAIIDILDRAKNLKDIEVTPVFKELFGVEGSVNIKSFMLNLDGFAKKLKLVNDENAINNSVFKEFTKLSKTSSFAVDKLKSSFNNLGIILGDALLPHITKIADKISEWTKKYEKLNPETKKMIGDFVVLTAGLLAFGVAVGGVSYALGGLALAMGAVSKAGKLMSGVDMLGMVGGSSAGKKIKKPLDMPKSKISMKNTFMSGYNAVNLISEFDKTPVNSNKLGFFKKLSNIIDKIGNSRGIRALGSLGVIIGGSAFASGAVAMGAFVLSAGLLIGIGAGIYSNWNNISKKLQETINLFKVLFSFESDGTMGRFGSGISLLIGKALEGVLYLINRTIEGFIVMKNMLSGMNIDEANLNMQYSLSKYDPKQQKAFNDNIVPEIKGTERLDLIDTQARLKYQQPMVNIQSFNNVVVQKDGTVTQETYSKNLNTGKTSTPTITNLPYSTMLKQGVR